MRSIFGTDGIRGIFDKELTYLIAYKVGFALGVLTKTNNPILIGRDTRVSGYILLEAISKGINAAGKEFIYLGICPTPAIPFLIKKKKFSSGIMISASHNPPEYNGIKIFDSNGEKIKKEFESRIELIMKTEKKNQLSVHKNTSIRENNYLLNIYTKGLIDTMEDYNLDGMKIILDTCYGSATTCAAHVFKKLGADVKVINNEKDGLKINLNCGSTNLLPLNKAIKQNNADMGFSFDGDADRVIGVDSKGNILDGDHILFLWGRELLEEKLLTNNTLISTAMANLGFENTWNNIGGILYRTEVGDKFIFEAIKKKEALLGGEQSGHILSNINNFCGDGILTAIQISKFCKKKNISLSSWLNSSFLPYPQKLTNICLNFDFKNLDKSNKDFLNETIESFSTKKIDNCRVYIRPSGTEPVLRVLVEAQNKKEVDFLSNKITTELSTKINKISNNF
ncbi:phosphoglucosamine mutase [Prochlorococcus sp. AH-716-E13]|nr:phosphoglucosamine mutase [Prochlorococcus sp. AH-716-E13]